MNERMIRRYILVDEYGVEDDDNEYADIDEAMDAARDQGYSVIVREFISVRAYPVYTAPTTGAARRLALTTFRKKKRVALDPVESCPDLRGSVK